VQLKEWAAEGFFDETRSQVSFFNGTATSGVTKINDQFPPLDAAKPRE